MVAREIADTKVVAGMVTTENLAEARARISGTLTKVFVHEGSDVPAGSTLAVIEDKKLELFAAAARAQVTATAAEADRAAADLGRTRALFDQGIYAAARLEQDQARAAAAAGAAAAARAQHAASLEMIAQGDVRAPAAGRVLRADVPAGAVVTAGQTVMTVTAGARVVRVHVTESQARLLRDGIDVLLSVGSQTADERGKILKVYPEVANGLVRVDIAAPDLDRAMVGQKATAIIPVGRRMALVIPERFVRTRFGLDQVTVLNADKALVVVPVQAVPGPGSGEREIISGLTAGDVIVGDALEAKREAGK